MKNKTFLPLISIAFILLSFLPINLTGEWVGYLNIPGHGNPIPISMNLVQHGDTLSGTLTGPEGTVDIDSGKIKDNDISFVCTGQAEGKMTFNGKAYADSLNMNLVSPFGKSYPCNFKKQN